MTDPVSVGNPAGYISGLIGEGTGSTEGLADFRDAGGAIRTQTWYRLWGEVTDSLARAGSFGDLDDNALPDPALYGTWSMGPGGQYATQVQVYFRDLDTGLVGHTSFTHLTDQPHTPGEAKQAAMDEYGDLDNASNYDQSIQGATVDMMYQTVPYER